ncbi:CoA ligase @ Long-chain fatty-acid-CoA ligase, Mycobacterial subgroup FadD4 [hydrothermal vent metagenome]|uniref:CoA ligase @ Long-chain fatty-acid-CoA ligase, Mycobacterial subgroup FadD4 n=1 Tax=hydrothermal vent metagenome TaxID=652676 RepID=A0A3B0RAF3_9ZZZZ
MHPYLHAQENPDKPAIIMAASGELVTYGMLDARSNQIAHLYRSLGFQIGETVAICMENHPQFFSVTWGSQRSGMIQIAISSRLTPDEISYILEDSGTKILIGSKQMLPLMDELQKRNPDVRQYLFGSGDARDLETALADMPTTPIADQRAGTDMLYSSGTTGQPKGIRLPLPEVEAIDAPHALGVLGQMLFGFHKDCIYLSPAPLYHAAPLRWNMAVHALGGTSLIMEKFDPERALQLIEKYQADVGQWVPTHFVRMLKLPKEVRSKYDVSSIKSAVHAAAPVPIPIKEAMIDWWGPVLNEYYAGTEGNGFVYCNSESWLSHKGTVGQPINCTVHICDEDGTELPVGEEGQIYFEGGNKFEYHNDPEKTKAATHPEGWTSLGDVGKLDEDGFVYLTDRKSFMIISGGVNIYPQEIENALITHDKVADAAVIGAPDPDMGEKVVAVVQPADMSAAGDDLAQELEAFLRQSLSGVKIPRQIDFRAELPRHPTGKLYKRLLRDEYWGKEGSKII